jgi:hypothetical protein
MAVADAVWKIKGASSRYITQRFSHLTDFRWQNGYAVLTFDYRALPRLVRYVRGQREHHSHRRRRQTPRALEPRALGRRNPRLLTENDQYGEEVDGQNELISL